MFEFLKKKKQAKTFASLSTDIHCHLLPGVDDGSSNINETISCLKTLYEVGFDRIYITPHFQAHYPNEEGDIEKRFEELMTKIASSGAEGIPEIAGISGEYRFDADFERKPGESRILPLPGNKLLCELSLHKSDYMPTETWKKYIELGYTLILAHPERYPYLNIHSPFVEEIKTMGVLFQVNLLSLNGFYGESAKRKGMEYIENGMSEYLGTDTHNIRYAKALADTANSNEVKELMKKHTFLNSQL